MNNTTLNNTKDFLFENEDLIPHSVQFCFFLIFLIPSILCSIFILYYLLSNRILRQALHYHAIIIFLFITLIYECTIYPWMIYFYYYNGIWSRSELFCTLWTFIDWGLYYTQIILFAWATIERHILIFHSRWILTRIKRLFIHYFTLAFLILYCLIYYTIITFFPSCENYYDDYFDICVIPCLLDSYFLHIYDIIIHQIIPNLIIIIFSLALFIRIYQQKRRVGKTLQWQKHWKMTVQLISISILYLVFSLPIALMNFLDLCGLSKDIFYDFIDYFLFFNYLSMLFCPFVCALSLPQVRIIIKNRFQFKRRQLRIISPMIPTIPDLVQQH